MSEIVRYPMWFAAMSLFAVTGLCAYAGNPAAEHAGVAVSTIATPATSVTTATLAAADRPSQTAGAVEPASSASAALTGPRGWLGPRAVPIVVAVMGEGPNVPAIASRVTSARGR